MLTRPLLFSLGTAILITWLTEHFGYWIAHSAGGMLFVLLASPGMIPAFFGLISSEYIAWTVAVGLTTSYYLIVLKGIQILRDKDAEKSAKKDGV